MKAIRFGRRELAADLEATREAYINVSKGGPEECPCEPCKNFIAARKGIYPAEVLALFHKLGISFSREAEVYHMARLQSRKQLYGGWFPLCGFNSVWC